jgi:hypothetical protein
MKEWDQKEKQKDQEVKEIIEADWNRFFNQVEDVIKKIDKEDKEK